VTADLAQATSLFRQACTDGDPRGCTTLGQLFQGGRGVVQDLNRAATLYDEACQKGDLAGCSAQAAMLWSGDRIGRDVHRAQALYQKTCAAGFSTDCYALAKTLSTSAADRKTAFELNNKACAGNVAAACHEVAVAWEAGRELNRAIPFYQKACAAGYQPACQRTKKLDQ
jgi:TPR repeat protein